MVGEPHFDGFLEEKPGLDIETRQSETPGWHQNSRGALQTSWKLSLRGNQGSPPRKCAAFAVTQCWADRLRGLAGRDRDTDGAGPRLNRNKIQDLPVNKPMLVHSFNRKDYLSHVKPRDRQ